MFHVKHCKKTRKTIVFSTKNINFLCFVLKNCCFFILSMFHMKHLVTKVLNESVTKILKYYKMKIHEKFLRNKKNKTEKNLCNCCASIYYYYYYFTFIIIYFLFTYFYLFCFSFLCSDQIKQPQKNKQKSICANCTKTFFVFCAFFLFFSLTLIFD